MNIRHLVLHNFRRYEHAKFIFHPRFTVLIGNNGTGKTTLLDALAIMLNTYFQGSGITTAGGFIKREDARLLFTEKEGQVFREPQTEVWLQILAEIYDDSWEWQRDLGDRGGKAKNIVALGNRDRQSILSGNSKDLPIMLYYGSGRLWNIHRDIKTKDAGSQLDAYRYALDPKSDQYAFEEWFKKLTLSELQKKEPIPAMQALKSVILECIPDATDFYFDIQENHIMIQLKKEGLVPFNYLSDGYRNMVAMVADIVHRASKLNPHFGIESANKTAGIVLIDEIDLHLHPKWQRRVVSDLKTAFPKMQFIVTSHSPFIIQSLEAGEIIDLDQDPIIEDKDDNYAGIAVPGPGSEYRNRSLEDIVEEIMGIDSPQRGQRYQKMYEAAKQYYSYLEEGNGADSAKREELGRKLDEMSAPFSDNVAYHAFLTMERLAAGFGSSNDKDEK